MTDADCNAALNRALVELGGSLLQYVGECWPWTPASDEEARRALERLVERQRGIAARIIEVLSRREWPIDPGGYPTEYGTLHYLAIHHLLRLLLESESRVQNELERAARECTGDPEAEAVLSEAAAAQQEIVAELRGLCRATFGAAA